MRSLIEKVMSTSGPLSATRSRPLSQSINVLLFPFFVFPERHRVVLVQHACAVDEFGVVRQRHVRVLRVGVVGIGGDAPAMFLSGGALHADFHELRPGFLTAGDPFGRDAGKVTAILRCEDGKIGVESLHQHAIDGRNVVELFV